jgi:predicted Zn-dependent peptidase
MSSIVFSELRERKALAYSTYARFSETEPNDGNSMFAYIGCQADKTQEAISSMQELLVNMPSSQTGFDNAKQALMKRISTERILDEAVLFTALEADKWGRKQQTAEITWNALQTLTLNDVQNFQKKYVKPLPYNICALGKSENLDFKALNKYAPVKEIKLEELFGY